MGMTVTDKIIRVSLILMVLLSLALSWKIWTNSSNHQSSNQIKTVSTLKDKTYAEVVLPTKIVLHENNKTIMSNRENLLSSNVKELQKLEMSAYEMVSINDQEKVNSILKLNDTIEYIFPDNIKINELMKVLENERDDLQKTFLFTRMVIVPKENKIYFLNVDSFQVAMMSYTGDLSEIEVQIDKMREAFFSVSFHHDILPFIYYINEDIWLKEYSYIVATQPFSMYTQAFFKDNNIRSSDDSQDVNYSNDEGERLIIQNDTGTVDFNGHFNLIDKKINQQADLFEKAFQYVRRTGSSLGNLRYFDNVNMTIIYRNYVEGFPVFSDANKGNIQVTINKDNEVSISTNVETIQVPIPSDIGVALPNTAKVIDELLAKGVDDQKIGDLQIGYKWETNPDSTQIVNLKPEWYVKYDNKWISLLELLSHLEEEAKQNEF